MTQELIVHIGHGKTGTSFIQATLAMNRTLLAQFGFVYPEHASFSLAEKGFISSGNGAVLFDAGFRVEGKTLLSGERLFHRLSQADAMERYLLSQGCSVKVVLYTRNVFEMLASSWGQSVKRGGNTAEFGAFLRDNRDAHHRRVLWWIEASKRHNFRIEIRNYSNHKQELFKNFAEMAFDDDAPHILREIGANYPKMLVNRSLNQSEYQLQSAFNRHAKGTGSFISDPLINHLPDIAAEVPYLDEDAHRSVVANYQKVIDSINLYLNEDELLKIESYEIICNSFKKSDRTLVTLEERQVDVLAASICAKLSGVLEAPDANCLRSIASKIGRGEQPGLDDALALMRLARRGDPTDQSIALVIEEYEKISKRRQEIAQLGVWHRVVSRLHRWFRFKSGA